MADLTTINASISSTTLVALVGSEFGFGIVPRVVALRVRCASLALYVLAGNGRL